MPQLSSEILWSGALIVACLLAAGMDIAARRIPNLLCLLTLLAGAAFAWASAGLAGFSLHAAHALIALVIGMALFASGLVGGGDAKFYAAVAMWFEPALAVRLLLLVSTTGIALFVVWVILRRLLRKPWRTKGTDPGDSLPYGVAIGGGAILSVLLN